jgi:hypothetical protein
MSVSVTDAYSDEETACPASWYGGRKEPRLLHVGDAERPLSDPVTGEPRPATCTLKLGDEDSRLREQLDSPLDRYWRDPISVWMTSRANRAELGTPFHVFEGFIAEAQPAAPLAMDITLTDLVTHALLVSHELERVPWRKVGEGFLNLLDAISDSLDRDQAEPILYGRHTRVDGDAEDPAAPAAFVIQPIYLGLETVNSVQRHVWISAGHACKSQTIRVDGVDVSEGSDWLVATQPAWLAEFGTPYIDKPSIHGVDRRYTLIYGRFGAAAPEACALGDSLLEARIEGIEDEADGSGALITDYYQQYKHFVLNYVANYVLNSYHSGPWLTSPEFMMRGALRPIVDEDSFDEASTIAAARRSGGLQGAAAIGVRGTGVHARQLIANWNIGGFVRFGLTERFAMGLVSLHPTQAAKDAAPLYSDAYDVLKETFGTQLEWNRQANIIDFRGDYRHDTGLHATTGIVDNQEEIANYNRNMRLEREYAYLPGLEQITHIAGLELATILHPPRLIRFEQTIGEGDADDGWLAFLNSGDYLRFLHFDAVGGRAVRLAQVLTPYIRGSARRAGCIAVDVEDLIGFDEPEDAS